MTQHVQVSAGGVFDLGCHVVWRPMYRRLVLGGPAAGGCAELIDPRASDGGWRIVALEIMPDHMYLFVNAHPSGTPSRIASQVEGSTTRWRRAGFPCPRSRRPGLWSRSDCAATAVAWSAETVRRYTARQNERRWRKERAR